MHRSLGLVALLLLAACDDKKPAPDNANSAASTAPEATQPVASIPTPAPDAGKPPREPHPQGASASLFSTVRSLEGITDELKTKIAAAEKVAAGVQDDPKQAETNKEVAKNLYTELASQVKAGKIDAAKLTPLYAAIEEATKARLEAEAEGLNQLHAALEPAQRKSLIAELRKREQAREEHLAAAHGGPDGGKSVSNRGDVHHIERLTKELDLDDAQKTSVGAFAVKDDGKEPAAVTKKKKATETLYTAFEKDTFDAKKLESFASKSLTEALEDESKFLTKLVPALKPEQREKLAAKVEKGWPLYDRGNPYLRNRFLGLPNRLGPGALGGMNRALTPKTQPPPTPAPTE